MIICFCEKGLRKTHNLCRATHLIFVFNVCAEPCEVQFQADNHAAGPGGGGGAAVAAPSAAAFSAPSTGPAPAAATPGPGSGSGTSAGSSTSSTSSCHHSPYDLRRKSPPHHDAGPSCGTLSHNVSSSFPSSLVPARKRPRRTHSSSTDCEYKQLLYIRRSSDL